DLPATGSHPVPVSHQSVTRSAGYRVPAVRQPGPVPSGPVPSGPVTPVPVTSGPAPRNPEPARQEIPEPPGPPLTSNRGGTSRTVNTAPCSCDGHMRRVPTHWDPPRN